MMRAKPILPAPSIAKKEMEKECALLYKALAKFVSLSEFYSDEQNRNRPLSTDFIFQFNANKEKLVNSDGELFFDILSSFALLPLDLIEEIQDILEEYDERMTDEDENLSDYDKSCDYLATRDGITDVLKEVDDINLTIAEDRRVYQNFDDPAYDPRVR